MPTQTTWTEPNSVRSRVNSDERVEIAVAVQIAQGHAVRVVVSQYLPCHCELAAAIIDPDPVSATLLGAESIEIAIAVQITQRCMGIRPTRHRTRKGGNLTELAPPTGKIDPVPKGPVSLS